MRRSLAVGSVLVMALAVGACGSTSETQAQTHFGQTCSLGAVDAGDPNNLTVNPEAAECASRVCLLPVQEMSVNGTGPFCTAACNVDSDCANGERRTGPASVDHRCVNGFSCRVVVPKLATNPLSCVPVCVCKDFLGPGADLKRQACPSP